MNNFIIQVGYSLGTGPLPWAMLGELLPNRVKTVLNSFVSCLNWLLAFGVTKSFPSLEKAIGLPAVFWIYAVLCALGVIFVMFVLIETKNKTLQEIQIALRDS